MAVYIPAISSDQYRLVMMKTTTSSPANGDWDNQDGSLLLLREGSGGGDSRIMSMWAVEDGSDIHIATQQANGRVAYHVFDPGTDAWTTTDEHVAFIGDTNFGDAPAALTSVSLALRSDGDVLICASYQILNADLGRVFSRQGGTWVNEGFASDGSSDTYGNVVIGPDSSDRISWVKNDSGIAEVETRNIASDDTLGGDTTVDGTPDTASMLVGPGVIDSANKIYVPYIDADNQISVASWTSAASPSPSVDNTMGLSTAAFNGATSAPFPALCLAVDGTDVHLLYSDSSFDLKHNDDVDGGGAGSETTLVTGTVNRVSCNKGTSDIHYVYDDNGATKYGIITLAGGPTAPFPGSWMTMGIGR